MPTYQVDVGDKTYEVDAPDPTTAWQWANYTHTQPAPKSAGFSLKDLGTAFGQGAVGSTEALTNVAGAGNAASEYLSDVNKGLQQQYTPERQAEMQRQQERMKKAEASGSTFEEIKAGAQNIAEAPLQSIAQGVGSFLPYVPAMFAGPVAAALGLGAKGAAAANVAAKVYTRGMGTAQGAGSVKGAIYDAVYKAEKEDGVPEEEAKQKAEAAQSYGGKNLAQIGLGGGLGYLASLGGIDPLLTKAGRAKAGERAFAPRVGTAVAEESLTEGAQGGQERLASNIALQNTGRDVPTFQGVAGQAAQDAILGGLTAGPVAAISGGKSKAELEQEKLKKEQDQFAEQEKAFAAQQAKTKAELQVPETLALPPPSKKIEPVKEEAGLNNPLGNITKEELGPEVSGYVDQYRKSNNLPSLQSYSIEDVKDAMTQLNPEGEKGALNSILTAKTGFSGTEKYTPQDVVNAAIEKNVAHETVGFQDFLQRTTGERDLNTMSPPQLYSAFKALSEMKREGNEQIVLPEGSNASRFTQDQYDKGRSYVTQQLAGGEPLVASPVRESLKGVTGLKTDRDVHNLLQAVIRNEDLNVAKSGDDYQISAATPVKDARAPLPQGYSIEEGTYEEGEVPAGFEITPEGKGKPLTTVDLEAEVAPKIERLTGLRQQEAAKMLENVNRYSGVVKAGQSSLDGMEARGLSGTEAFAKAKAQQARRQDILSRRIQALMDRIEEMSAPLKSKPVGKKAITSKKHTLYKDGKALGTFPSRLDAESSMLTQLSDQELDQLSSDTRFGGITDRATKEKERRKAPAGLPVKGTEAGLAKAGVYTQATPEMAELEKKLVAALSKFGLKDVALKVVRAIENNAEGSYEAKLIKIALDASNPVRTMRHEAIHALKELGFFTKDQWRVLEKKASDEWVQRYLGQKSAVYEGKQMSRLDAYRKMGLSESELLEEAIADAFGDFDVNKAPPGMMMALLNKLRNFFKALRQALTGAGFESAEDIFGKIETGKLDKQMDKADKAGSSVEKKQEKLSLPEPSEEKAIDPNDVSRLISDGPYDDAALRILGSQVTKTSKPLEVDEVGVLFDQAYLDKFGKQGDWRNPSDFQSAVAQAIKELKFQMKQSKSGLDWYDQDIADAFKLTQRYIPSLKKPEKRALFSVIAGIMSPSTNARDNWVIAAQAYQHYEKTGILPGVNPASGVLWMGGLESANKKKQLDMLNAMLQPKSKGGLGEKGAIEWLQNDHAVSEITKFREKYGGMGKSSAGGKATDIVPGYSTFGPKVGPFVMNINGLHEVTVDVWMTRTFNRYFGQMMGPDGKMVRAPTEPQRVAIKQLATEAAKELGIKPYQVQSVLWFFEQQMFNKLGTGAKSYGFSDGAIKFIETQGGVGVSSAPSTNVGANATANQPTGKQNVGVGTQADKPRARTDQQATQQGPIDEELPSGEPTVRSSTRGKQKFSLSGERRGQREDSRFTPLALAPSVEGFHGPDPRIVEVAERYAEQNGIDLKRQAEYVQVEGNKDAEDRATRIAKAYEDMRHDPQNPEVKEAYQNLIDQTIAQYEALVDAGYKFWFIDLDNSDNLDYLSSPWNALRDMRSNKQMGIFPTNVGFGSNEDFDPSNNPLLQETDFEWPIGGLNGKKQKVLANDVFRAVHDAFGHGLEGAGFRATGEENAWQAHSRLFTGSALKAITSETRGQNSAVNYGPNGEFNQKASPADTIYADQKVGLMPTWTWKEGLSADEPTFQKLNSKKDAQRFLNAVERVKVGRPYAFPLHVHDLDTYKNAKLFLSEDEESGFALIGDEIGSFFSGGRGQAYPTLRLAVDEGGRRIDTYRTKLPSVMGKAHFRPVARVEFNAELATPLWDKNKFKQFQGGKPDLVFYAYDPSFNVSGDKDAGDLAVSETPLVEYDEAVNLQKEAVKDAKYSLRGITLGEQQPEAQSFSGTHYGNAKVDTLAGSKYGTGIRGAERRRLDNAFDDRIKRRAYFYVAKEDGTMPLPESGLGGHVYTQKFDNILGPGKEMSRLFSKARGDSNDFESNVVDAGYDGYAVPNMGMMVILNHDVPVNYEGTKAEFDAKKPKLSLRTAANPDIRYSLREFKVNDLPKTKQTYTIPANTLLFHGAHKKQADKIESAGKILLAKPPVKTSGGTTEEGGLIFFGEKQTAEDWANNLGDPMSVIFDEEAGNKREKGVVFQTETDRPYKLIRKNYKLSKSEAEALTESLGLPDYKRVSAGDTASMAAFRASAFNNSNAPRYIVEKAGRKQEMSAPWPIIFDNLGVDGFFDDFAVALSADNGIRLVGKEGRMEKFSLRESVAVDKNGKPLELYHATYSAFDKPKINYGSDEWKQFGFHVGPLEAAQNRLDIKAAEDKREGVKSGNAGANIIPVYLDIRNPLRLDENRTGRWGVNDIMSAIMEKADKDEDISKTSIDLLPEDVEMYMRDEFPIEAWLKGETDPNSENFDPNAESRNWSDDSDFGPGEKTKLLLDFLKTLGYDSIVYKNEFEGGGDSYIALNANQVKSQFRPEAKFSLRDIKAEIESMPNGVQMFSAIKGATTTREEKGWAERITSFVAPRSFSQMKAQALNRYNRLAESEKLRAQANGGIERLADSNAHSAALMSDLHAGVTAQVLGVDDGVGGTPVYDKGYTTVSNLNGTVKGPIEIFKRLAAVGDPTIYQAYQFWAAAKRGKRLLGEGREQNIDQAGIGFAQALEAKYPMFVDIQKEWIKFNNGLVKYQIDTGVISKEMGEEWMKYADYLPFYRQLDGENTAGPKIYQSISGVKPTRELKGSKAPLADFLETIVRNTHAAVQAGMKNVAAQRAGQLAVDVGIGERLDGPATGHDIITALENGKQVFYRIGDDLFVDAVTSLNIPELPFMSFLTAPSNLLRNLVTKDPGFMLTNLMRDSVSAYVTSGANIKPMIDTVQEFTQAMRNKSPVFEMLRRAGVVGGYDYSKGVQASTENFAKQLRKRSGTQTKTEKRLKPVTGIWDFLEKGSEASDAATRIAVFKDTLKRTGNEAEALLQALEVMNFNRKGSSALIRIATAGIPFLNARMQGLDILYRSGIRPIFSGTNPTEREKQIQRTFFVRAGMIMGISLMYAAAVKDEPEYEAQEEETKDNNWLITPLGIRIPTPFEIGFIFKTIPERIYRWAFSGSDTAEEFSDSMKRGLVSTFAVNPIPQAALPLVEAVANYSAFTMRPIVGQNLLSIDPKYQVGPSTSVMAERLGEQLGVSPMKIDHIYKGYTGTMGMYLVDTLDTVFDLFSDNPRPAKRFEQTPVLKRFLIDKEARGNVTAYYAFKHSVDEAVRTTNMLEKRLNEDAGDYQEKKQSLLDLRKYVAGLDKQMNKLQDEANMIRSSGMPATEKRDALLEITQIQNELTSDIRSIKKMAKET